MSKSPTNKARWFRLMAALGVPLVLLCVAEVGLRLVGFGYDPAFFVRGTLTQDLVTNQRFGNRFFPHALVRRPSYTSVSTAHPAGHCRVFVFGESAALGDPDPKFGFSRILQTLLRERYPGIEFEFVNTAMVAINSHVVRPIAQDCASLNGDIWIVCMGNNEPTGVFGTSKVYSQGTPPLVAIRTLLALKKTRVGQLLDEILYRFGSEKNVPTSWKGMEMQADQYARQGDVRMQSIYHNFESNLRDILQAGSRAGVQTILCTVPVNLRDCPPMASMHRADLKPEDLAHWQELYQTATAAETGGNLPDAVTRYEKALTIDDSYADLRFRLAHCYSEVGKTTDAKNSYQLARDLDAVRLRADSAINQIIRKTGTELARSGVHLLDAESAFAQQTKDGVPGAEWFYEHVHFRFNGNYLMARLFAEQIEQFLPGNLANLAQKKGDWLTQEQCAGRLGYTTYSFASALETIVDRVERPPFVNQSGHAEMLASLKQEQAQLRPLTKSTGLARDIARCRSAVAATPNDWVLHNLLGYMLISAGDRKGAATEWRRVTELAPDYAQAYCQLSNLTSEDGDAAATESLLATALRVDRDSAQAHHLLGRLRERQGRRPEALRELKQALRLAPDNETIRADLGRVSQGGAK